MAPATPPAIAAVLDFGTGLVVWSADWPVVILVGALSVATEVEAAGFCAVYVSEIAPPGASAVSVDTGDDVAENIMCEIEEAAAKVRLGATSRSKSR